jgi:protein-disulfide isomerase
MPKKTLIVATSIALFVLLALGGWWYLSSPSAQDASLDRSALVRPHSPGEGRADAPVVIVEFFDPACETCRAFYPKVKQLMAQHPGRIRLVMRYAPFHKGSDKVVTVLAAAHRQGKFWPALEALFAGQEDWASQHTAKVDLAWKYLGGIGLNMEQMAFDLTAPELVQAVAQDLADANTLGVAQTPEYFVNGRPLPTFGFDQLRELVNEELAKAP